MHSRHSPLALRFASAVALATLATGCGGADATNPSSTSTSGTTATAAKAVDAWGGERHVILLKSDGSVWTWGSNVYGILGQGTATTNNNLYAQGNADSDVPLQVVGAGGVGFLNSVAAVMSGEPFCYVLKTDGTVWAWGWNSFGELGTGTFTDSHVPTQVTGLTSVVALGGRGYHALAIRSDGSVWTWGLNTSGELGDGTTTSSNVPLHVAGISTAVSVTGGYEHSVVLLANKTLVAWGKNGNGELGIGASGAAVMSPTPVPGLSNVVQVSAGWEHTLAVTGDGTVWAWGGNFNGEIGDGTTTDRPAPYNVPGLTGIKEVSGGDCHSAALKSDGTVWTWGCNTWGQLGNGGCTDQHTPVQVMVSPGVPLTGITIVRARDYHNVAIKSDGTVWSWGWNVNGQLGDGSWTHATACTTAPANGAPAGTDNSPYAVQVKGV